MHICVSHWRNSKKNKTTQYRFLWISIENSRCYASSNYKKNPIKTVITTASHKKDEYVRRSSYMQSSTIDCLLTNISKVVNNKYLQ